MNTLQKVSDLEATVKSLEDKMKLFENMAKGLPSLTQDVARTNKDVAMIVESIKNLTHAVNKRTGDLHEINNTVITKLMGLEQNSASLAKMFAAVVSELSDAKIIDQAAVLIRLRVEQEKQERAQVEEMLKMNIVKASPYVSQDSVIVVAQTFTPKDESKPKDVVSEYRILNLANPEIENDAKKEYFGKSPGDKIYLNLDDGTLETTVAEVYDYVKVYKRTEGESAPQNQGSPAEQPPPQV